jgi:hypothetical protein
MMGKKGGSKGHHKIRGKAKNMAQGVSPKSISANTMKSGKSSPPNRATGKSRQVDKDLKHLRGY